MISPPYAWQVRFNASDVEVRPRIDTPVEPRNRAGSLPEVRGFPACIYRGRIAVEDFDSFPATRRTLRQFITACHELDALVRDIMLPNPDTVRRRAQGNSIG